MSRTGRPRFSFTFAMRRVIAARPSAHSRLRMLNDIFATSMHGRYSTTESGRIVEQGEWSYRGFGNGEITMSASAERPVECMNYELRLHSAERQLDEIYFRSLTDDVPTRAFHAKIAGHILTVAAPEDDGGDVIGNLTVPPETVYDGPSPIWLIHLVMTAPPPTDRLLTTPVVRFSLDSGELGGLYYRIEREGNNIAASVLDEKGNAQGGITINLAEDGCPKRIVAGATETEILRLPSA
jgi:hypothetical protein